MLGLGVSVFQMMALPMMSLLIGALLLIFPLMRIKSNMESTESPLGIRGYFKGLGCLGLIGVAFFLNGLHLAIRLLLILF